MNHCQERFVAHLDILGFLTLSKSNPTKGWEMLEKIHAILLEKDTEFSITKDGSSWIHAEISEVRHVFFSDTIILYSSSSSYKHFIGVVNAAARIFQKSILDMVPLRCGIAKGVFCVDEERSMYAGPALIDAYSTGEESQWLGVVFSKSVDNEVLRLRSNTNMISSWNVPLKSEGHALKSVLNWPFTLELRTPPPLSSEQLYSAFQADFGPYERLPECAKLKYLNTVKFMNHQLKRASTPPGVR